MRQTSLSALVAVAVLGATACSANTEDYTSDAETGSTHAFITVDRSVAADGTGSPRAGAIAGFVRMPAEADAHAVLAMVGLGLQLPAPGQCTSELDRNTGSRSTLAATGRVVFLDAGDVAVDTGDGPMTLAPRAFPTVTDRISGVMYTTRDRSAEPLPPGVRYVIRTSGGDGVAPVSVEANAPAPLDGITIGGVPLADVRSVPASAPVDVTWNVGAGGDLVYIELAAGDGSSTTLCTFKDDVGAGTVPAGAFERTAQGRLSVHRVRSREFTVAGVDQGELRFDFERAATVDFD